MPARRVAVAQLDVERNPETRLLTRSAPATDAAWIAAERPSCAPARRRPAAYDEPAARR